MFLNKALENKPQPELGDPSNIELDIESFEVFLNQIASLCEVPS